MTELKQKIAAVVAAALQWIKDNFHYKTMLGSFGAGFVAAKFNLFSLIVSWFG